MRISVNHCCELHGFRQDIKSILAAIDESGFAVVGYQHNGICHAVLAYAYEYNMWTKYGISYNGCIRICDPDHMTEPGDEYCIYFNTNQEQYNWIVPAYGEYTVSSEYGAYFYYITNNIQYLNGGGLLDEKTEINPDLVYFPRMKAHAISEKNHSVQKISNQTHQIMQGSEDDIVRGISYFASGTSDEENKGILTYTMKDSTNGYQIQQEAAQKLTLSMQYENLLLYASSPAGKKVTFAPEGYVSVTGQQANFALSITSNKDCPTDWFTISASGTGATNAELKIEENGYFLSASQLQEVNITANNKEIQANVNFSTEYDKVFLYEINKNTIGVNVDTDGDGDFETEIARSNQSSFAMSGDVNLDETINAEDAALILIAASRLGSGLDSGLTEQQEQNADVNEDATINAVDASGILRYAAYRGTGGKEELKKFLEQSQ